MRAMLIAVILLLLPMMVLADPVKVVVQPFSNDATDPVSSAVQASIVADLSRAQGLTAEAGPVAMDSAKAIELAKQRGARFLLIGAYHVLEGETRFTGQVVDLSNGTIVGGLKATGMMRDLFGLEDQLAQQAQRAMLQTLNPQPAPAPAQQPTPAPTPAEQPSLPATNTFEGSALERSLRGGDPMADNGYQQSRRNLYYGVNISAGPYGYYGTYWGSPFVVSSRPLSFRYYRPIPYYGYTW